MDDAATLPHEGVRLCRLLLKIARRDLNVEVLLADFDGGSVAGPHHEILFCIDLEVLILGFDLDPLTHFRSVFR